MRQLRVVGSSADHEWLILSNKPKGREGSHALPIDKKLLDVLQRAVYAKRDADRAEHDEARAERRRTLQPKLPPREIQRLLRAGVPPAVVAKRAEVDEDYVDQFYTPILYERRGVIQDAQAIYQEKPRAGLSAIPLGEAVAANLSSRYVKMGEEQLAAAWMATRQDGEPWLLTLSFPFRGRTRVAKWRYDARTKTVAAANKLATDFGWIAPGKRPAMSTAPPPARTRAAGKRAATPKRAAARKPAAKSKSKKPAARKTPARKPAAKKATARKPAAKKAPARKPASRKATARKSPPRKPATRKPPAKKSPARKPAARKSPTRKPAARKSPTRRPAARKPARKTPSRKPAARRSPARKAPARKAPSRKVAPRKPAARKPAARRPAPRKATRGRRR